MAPSGGNFWGECIAPFGHTSFLPVRLKGVLPQGAATTAVGVPPPFEANDGPPGHWLPHRPAFDPIAL